MPLLTSSAAYTKETAIYENALLLEGPTQNIRRSHSDDIASTRSSTLSSQELHLEEKNDL
jgi:hypothetical protein